MSQIFARRTSLLPTLSLDQVVHDHYSNPNITRMYTSGVRSGDETYLGFVVHPELFEGPTRDLFTVRLHPDLRDGPESSDFEEVIDSPWGASMMRLVSYTPQP